MVERDVQAAGDRVALSLSDEALGAQEIGVDQAGEEHSDQKGFSEARAEVDGPRRLELLRESHRRVGRQLADLRPPLARVGDRVGGVQAGGEVRGVGEPRVMPRDQKGQRAAKKSAVGLHRDPRARRGVVAAAHPRTLAVRGARRPDIGLEPGAGLADVMQQPRGPGRLRRAEDSGEHGREIAHLAQVDVQPLPFFHGPVRQGVSEHAGHRWAFLTVGRRQLMSWPEPARERARTRRSGLRTAVDRSRKSEPSRRRGLRRGVGASRSR